MGGATGRDEGVNACLLTVLFCFSYELLDVRVVGVFSGMRWGSWVKREEDRGRQGDDEGFCSLWLMCGVGDWGCPDRRHECDPGRRWPRVA